MSPVINLDHNATTPAHPQVVRAVSEAMEAGWGNAASQHAAGRQARALVEQARENVLTWLGGRCESMHADQLIFTSGGTEANDLALRGLAGPAPGRIAISRIEHPSVTRTAQMMQTQGFELAWIDVAADGQIVLDHARQQITPETRLVSVMWANNETGVIQPIAEIAHWCNSLGVPFHTDATQAVGKLTVDFRESGASAMTFAAHKFHGPRGIGGLVVRHGVEIQPTLFGGFQQAGLRPGTESVELVAGVDAAANLWKKFGAGWRDQMLAIRRRFESQLLAELPEIEIHGQSVARLPQTTAVAFAGLDRQALVMALDLASVACSTGSACASGSSEPSHVLLAMGLKNELVEGSIRLSWGAMSTAEECAKAASRIISCVNDLRAKKTRSKLSPPSPQ